MWITSSNLKMQKFFSLFEYLHLYYCTKNELAVLVCLPSHHSNRWDQAVSIFLMLVVPHSIATMTSRLPFQWDDVMVAWASRCSLFKIERTGEMKRAREIDFSSTGARLASARGLWRQQRYLCRRRSNQNKEEELPLCHCDL